MTAATTPSKPASPPPAYTEIADPTLAPNTQSSPYQPNAGLSSSAQFPSHSGYGPTSIVQQQAALIPYYDPRSPHAVAEAGTRARRRFIGAVLWAIFILLLAGSVMGWEIRMEMHGRSIVRRFLSGQETWKDQ